MFYRIVDILCHPSRIGLYIKDKFYVVILMFIFFAVLFLGVLALKVYPSDYYSLENAENISFALSKSNMVPTIEYKDKKIVGEKSYMIVMDDFSACFLPENYSTNNEITKKSLNMAFYEDHVDIYYGSSLAKTTKYEDLTISDFNFNNVYKGVTKDRIHFEEFMFTFLDSVELHFKNTVYLQNSLIALGYYAIALFVSALFSFYVNPGIAMKVRWKLLVYDSLIYFFGMVFSVIFAYGIIEYIALVLPLIYTNITFRHIIRIRK